MHERYRAAVEQALLIKNETKRNAELELIPSRIGDDIALVAWRGRGRVPLLTWP